VRDRVVYPENMVGDFVLIRSSGLPVYNYCCVVDDIEMKITHVIRGEDHLSNTVRQLMIYEAFNASIPEFAHLSLLIGKDRQKLSKRHGATSLRQYKDEHYLPSAVINYLCLLGWSNPEEKDIFHETDLVRVFNLDRLSRSPAIYDIEKFNWVNGEHLKKLDHQTLRNSLEAILNKAHPYYSMPESWKTQSISFFKNHLHFFTEFERKLNEDIFYDSAEITDVVKEIRSWETTPKIESYVKEWLGNQQGEFLESKAVEALINEVKEKCQVKGKPLFMGIRTTLTLKDHGPELKDLIPLTPLTILKKRLGL
jgi:glutamyl-tRNA synthetase